MTESTINPITIFIVHIIFYTSFPLFVSLQKSTLRLSFAYINIALVLFVGGFLGAVYALPLTDSVTISGGSLAYGGLMLSAVIYVIRENDAKVIKNIISMVVVINVFKFILFSLLTIVLSSSDIINPFNTAGIIFDNSVKSMIIGGALIIIELFILILLFEKINIRVGNYYLKAFLISIIFIGVLVLDGVLFPLFISPFSPSLVSNIVGGVQSKIIMAFSYSITLLMLLAILKTRILQHKESAFSFRELLNAPQELLVNELKRQQQTIKESEKLFSQLFELLPMGVTITDKNGNIIEANQESVRLLGISKTEHLKRNYAGPEWEIVNSDGHPMPASEYASVRAMKENRRVDNIEMGVVKDNGEITWLNVSADPIPIEGFGVAITYQDVSKLKQAEKALIKRNQFIETVLDNLPIGLAVNYLDNGIATYMNKKFQEIYGWPRERMKDLNSFFLCVYPDPEYRETIKKQITNDIESGDPERMQWDNVEITQQDGQKRIVSARNIPLIQQNLMISTVQDITKNKQTENALISSEERFNLAVQGSNDGIWDWKDSTKENYWWSDRVYEMLGYSPGEVKPTISLWKELMHPDDRSRVKHILEEHLQGETPYQVEFRMRKKNGKYIWVYARGATSKTGDKDTIRMAGSVTDITRRKEMEAKLKKSEFKYRNLVETSYDLIWAIDTNGIVTFMNNAAERIYGYKPEELIGKHWTEIAWSITKEDAIGINKSIMEEGGSVIDYISEMRHKDGHKVTLKANSVPQFDEQGNYLGSIGTSRDISEELEAEEEKQKLEMHLRQQQKLESIGTLASGVAHEINNPITGVMNYAQLISERLEPTQVQLQEYANGIKHETERVAEIVRNLLDFSRHEKQSHSPARLADIIETTLSLIRTVIRKDEIDLRVEIPGDLPKIKCRSQQIQQVLMNLLTNARDAVNDRYPEYDPDKIIKITVGQFEKEGRRWLRTTVEDHGTGIPAEIREKIYTPFFTTKDRAKGTGLGLPISQGIVLDHHGMLTFESEENKFTRFYMDLPVDNGWDIS